MKDIKNPDPEVFPEFNQTLTKGKIQRFMG